MSEEKRNIDNQEQNVRQSSYTTEDIEKNKKIAGLSYLLFFLPFIVCPESRYAIFHANQSLILLITAIVGNVILSILPLIGWMLLPLFAVGVLIMVIIGLVNGFEGKANQLPLIGKFTILK